MDEHEKPQDNPKFRAEMERANMKGWKEAAEALETSTFHGRHASAIAALFGICKNEYEASQKRLDAALDQIKIPPPSWGKTHDEKNLVIATGPEKAAV